MSGGGGKGGGGKGQQQASGVSPEQAALAEYTFGQGAIGEESQFANEGNIGLGESTMLTQAIGGKRFGEAKQLADMAQADASAQNSFNQQRSSALEQLAGQAGQAFGGLGGGGGGGGFTGVG